MTTLVAPAAVSKALRHQMCKREMSIFDSLPKCVRDVVNAAPVGILPSSIVKHANNVAMIQQAPERFAQLLEWELHRISEAKSNVR